MAASPQQQQQQFVVAGYKIVDHNLKSLVNPSPDPNQDLRFQFVVGERHVLPPLLPHEKQRGLQENQIMPCKRGFHFCNTLVEAVLSYWQITSRMKNGAANYRVLRVHTDSPKTVYVESDVAKGVPGKLVTDDLVVDYEMTRQDAQLLLSTSFWNGNVYNDAGHLV